MQNPYANLTHKYKEIYYTITHYMLLQNSTIAELYFTQRKY